MDITRTILFAICISQIPCTAVAYDADISICVSGGSPKNLGLRVSILWHSNRRDDFDRIVLGALDATDVVYPQNKRSLQGKDTETREIVVGEVSAYPLEFAVYGLTTEAVKELQKPSAKYFDPEGKGVTVLSGTAYLDNAKSGEKCGSK